MNEKVPVTDPPAADPAPVDPPPPPSPPNLPLENVSEAHAANVQTAADMHLSLGQDLEAAATWLYTTAVYEGERAFTSVEHALSGLKTYLANL
jgi:hypothetical protein